MAYDLTDDDKLALTRPPIEEDRYLLSPRLAPLKAILAKLQPPAQHAEPPPALKPADAPRPRRPRR
jgi:hypothetical protein